MKHIAIAMTVLFATVGCATLNPDSVETAQIGREQLDRHGGNPDIAPVAIGMEPGSTSASPASANDDDSELFGDVGLTPTTFEYVFEIPEGMTDEEVLQLAGTDVESRGGVQTADLSYLRSYRFDSLGDEIKIELRATSAGLLIQTVTIRDD